MGKQFKTRAEQIADKANRRADRVRKICDEQGVDGRMASAIDDVNVLCEKTSKKVLARVAWKLALEKAKTIDRQQVREFTPGDFIHYSVGVFHAEIERVKRDEKNEVTR
jgi:hypothetical protein